MTETPRFKNRKAYHNYTIIEKFEAGISLQGNEVKSIREGHLSLNEAFVRVVKDEVWLINCHILPYSKANTFSEIDPTRKRKLLLHKNQIKRLIGLSATKGYAIIPLSAYFSRGKVKVEIALCSGKKKFDKRETIKKREQDRKMQQALRSRYK